MTECLLNKIIQAYEEEGYQVSVGLNTYMESRYAAFAILIRIDDHPLNKTPKNMGKFLNYYYRPKVIGDIRVIPFLKSKFAHFFDRAVCRFGFKKEMHTPSKNLSTGWGISVEEIYFFDNLLNTFQPKNIYLIGIAFGWSTIAIGLLSPGCKLYGIDNCSEGDESQVGINLTKRIAEKFKINLNIFVGSSPQDVPASLSDCDGKLDLIFIDGLHTNEQLIMDFNAVLPFCSDSAVIVCHDVLNFRMLEGWENIMTVGAKNSFDGFILRRTTSGIGVLFRNVEPSVIDCIKGFYQDPELLI